MNFKIFKCKDKQEALLYVWVDDDGEWVVEIKSFIGPATLFHSETVSFENQASAQRFIKDFSQEAAQEFIDRFVI